ncbi:MAG: prepilin-type N-terminal cleavage/methylation domain-containing protein [Lachnospiraceae bacterium]|jgi:prepilin-type N-terminal cleavage/methylation domain-containing protein|nr:prepilin-type N-terminal cleavage/methylation domain-containing protein [Lachnospiraceae bacterium]
MFQVKGEQNKQNKKGFTLAELLIVVAIIAVLVAISIPIFTAQIRKARLAANKANARAALSAAMAEFIDAPEKDKELTIKVNTQHMYFRYDTATGHCKYLETKNTSPQDVDDFHYNNFANIGYEPGGNGLGLSNVAEWKENQEAKLMNGSFSSTVLTDRTYRYWDVAMQGDGTFTALVCLW